MSFTILSKNGMILNGQSASAAHADLHEAVTSLSLRETITGASTLTVNVSDPQRILVTKKVLAEDTRVTVDGVGFTLRQIRKTGNGLTLTFEDSAVAALRKHTAYLKAAAGTVSRVGFCQRLIREEPWVVVHAAPGALSKVELARGSVNTDATDVPASTAASTGGLGNYGIPGAALPSTTLPSSAASKKKAVTAKDRKVAAGVAAPENTWDAAGRIMGEINWRVFSVRSQVTIAPDSWVLAHGLSYPVTEKSPGVDSIDWDWDAGKPAATAELRIRCGTTTSFPAGSRVTLSGEGVADGDWLCETIERTDRDTYATVSLVRPQPVLAEPDASSLIAGGLNAGEGGWPTDLGLGADGGAASSSAKAEQFVQLALQQNKKPYVWGASGPTAFDCSGLVQWAADQILNTRDANGFLVARDAHDRRGDFPKPVGSQLSICRAAGTLLTVQQAISTRGALLIRGPNEHIAISLGNGTTIEARGKAYGVGVFPSIGRSWTTGAYVPGIPVVVSNGRSGIRGD